MTPLTMNCVADSVDTLTATGMYGSPGINVAINVTEDGRACAVYLDPEKARRLRDWLNAALGEATSGSLCTHFHRDVELESCYAAYERAAESTKDGTPERSDG